MRTLTPKWKGLAMIAMVLCVAVGFSPVAWADWEVPAGTRFLVELKDKLEAKKVKRGKQFEARTLEALRTSDGRAIPAGAKIVGRVSYSEDNQMMLRFERIESARYKLAIVASVARVMNEKDVRDRPGEEGEIKSDQNRGKSAAIGAIVGGGIGAAAGATQGGGKEAAIGAGAGAAVGALIGAAAGGKELVLYQGTRLELQLDRPLYIPYR